MKNIKILFRGLWRALCGSFVVGGVAGAGYGFTLARAIGGGSESVFVAFGSTALLALSLFLMWSMGGGCRPAQKDVR